MTTSLVPAGTDRRTPAAPAAPEWRKRWNWKKLRRPSLLLATNLGAALAAAFLIPLPWIGIILWIAIALANVRRAMFGLLGLIVGDAVGRGLGVSDLPALGGGIKANALLTAIAAAWLTAGAGISLPLQLLIAALAAGASAVLTAAIMRALTGTIVPSLVWGFCLVAGALFVLFPIWTTKAVELTAGWLVPTDLAGWFAAFLRSLGSLMFSPTVEVGVVVALAVLLWSRAVFLAGAVGWLVGAFAAVGFENLGVQYYWLPASYNFFIAGMGLGAVFFLPGRTSIPMAATGGYGAAAFGVVLQHISPGWAYLPVSSALAIWVGLCAFAITEDRSIFWRNYSRQLPPEEAWLQAFYWSRRVGRHEPLLTVPVAGPVQVTQGFDGKLSHVGQWHHALDFQRPAAANAPDPATSIWGATVTAPAPGVIEQIRDGIADNPLGVCNYADNWGNYVLIRLDQGGWALLAHLQRQSVAVGAGSRVDIGTVLGAVGNSGRSPLPHLHLQVQYSPAIGAATMPFRLANYESVSENGEEPAVWHAAAVPAENATIIAATPAPAVHAILASLAPGAAVWVVETQGRIPRAFNPTRSAENSVRVDGRFDAAGRHILRSSEGGVLTASADADAWRIIELHNARSPLLRMLALGAPSIPHAARVGLTWREPVPPAGTWAERLISFSRPYRKRPFTYVVCRCTAEPAQNARLAIEAEPERPTRSLPRKLRCEFDLLRGPTRIEAAFAEGRIVYSLLSFAPGQPFEGGET